MSPTERRLKPALVLIRHGETSDDDTGLLSGHRNTPLNSKGQQAARQIAGRLLTLPISRILSSDLLRASQTAAVIGKAVNKPVETTRILRSWNIGRLQGQPYEKVKDQVSALLDQPNLPAPGGESLSQLLYRFLPYLEGLMKEAQQHPERGITVVVAHGIIQEAAEGWLKGGMQHWSVDLGPLKKQHRSDPGQALALTYGSGIWRSRYL